MAAPDIRARLAGLYVITDAELCAGRRLEASVAAAVAGGARIVQYRDKSDDTRRRYEEASALRAVCRAHDALFIVNDDIELAGRVMADGVHIGRDDAGIGAARAALGARAVIGVSCYDRLDGARSARAAGADYVAFGSMFASPTKPGAVTAPLSLLGEGRELGLPVCAIGGIRVQDAAAVVDAGADMLAVISGVFGAADIRAAAAAYLAAWS